MNTRALATVAPLRYAPVWLVETLNGPPEELDPDLKWLVTQWLTVKGHMPRFITALLKAGRSAKPFTEAKVQWFFSAPADAPGMLLPLEGGTQAENYFLQFVRHPDSWRLGGPCLRCRKYFLRETRHVTRYCSRKKCGKAASVSRFRDKAHDRNLKAINEAIEAWRQVKTEEDWRSYVAQRAGVTQKLLTRWANEGTITIHDMPRGK